MSSVEVAAGRPVALVRRRRTPVLVILASTVLAGVVAMALFHSVLAPHDPTAQDLVTGLTAPTDPYLLGTDQLGRDVFSRVIAGAAPALVGPLIITMVSLVVGNALGLLAGYRGGRVDAVIMRWVDMMWSIPSVLVVIVVAAALGGGYWLTIALLALLTIPFDTRIVRGAVLEQMPRPYVEAARVLGVPAHRIAIRHVWPNIAPTAIANAFLVFANSLVAIASVSFLGLGIDPSTPDWGVMIAQNQAVLFANPAAVLTPALLIVATAASVNVIGDAAYAALARRGGER
ncbi:ABC transporter permease [Gordonia hongkongensis]|uniref:ABC transporter permease n=1 Tax=Gordonia hongkongensis TaxID=1701090 RepID=UPI003EBA8744